MEKVFDKNFAIPQLILIYRKGFEYWQDGNLTKAVSLFKMPANIAMQNKLEFTDRVLYYLGILGLPMLAITRLWEQKNIEAREILGEYAGLLQYIESPYFKNPLFNDEEDYKLKIHEDSEYILQYIKMDLSLVEGIITVLTEYKDHQYNEDLLMSYEEFYKKLLDGIESEFELNSKI